MPRLAHLAVMLGLVAAALFSGCVTPSPAPATTEGSGAEPPGSFTVPTNATDCTRVLIAMPVPKAAAQALLPEGFSAADAQEFFGLPAADSGRATALVSVQRCTTSELEAGYDEAAAGIVVRPPDLASFEAVSTNVYELGRATSGPAHQRLLEQVGWNRLGNELAIQYPPGPAPSAWGNSSQDGQPWLAFDATGTPPADTFSERARWWHKTPTGIGFFQYGFTINGHLGPGSCELSGGPLERLAGTECPAGSLFLVAPPYEFTGQFRHMAT